MNSNQLTVTSLLTGAVLCLCGCQGFRYAATEAQKENAWLHSQVCAAAAETAQQEEASSTLCDLTAMAGEQSQAFVADYGLPESDQYPQASSFAKASEDRTLEGATLKNVLSQAKADSLQKPDVWSLADSAIEFGIAVAGLFGGVYGVRIAGTLKTAREKSTALREIVQGNELFKQLYPEQADRLKESQSKQSPATKQLVTQLKAG